MYDDAQLACEEMVAAGITPDSIAFGTLFVALNKANRSEKVLQIEKSSRARGILFDDVAYTETLLACSRYCSDFLKLMTTTKAMASSSST